MTNFEFTEYPENFFSELGTAVAELAKFSEGDVVSIGGSGGTGVVGGVMTENFEFPTGSGEDDLEEVEASSDSPVYIVATKSGMRAVSEDSLEKGSFNGDQINTKKLTDAELGSAYDRLEDPYSTAELLNMPGVDDPEVGFSSLPKGWDRTSVLKAWAALGGSFTTCRTEMAGDISRPTNFCAALKDEVYMTERWRNRF